MPHSESDVESIISDDEIDFEDDLSLGGSDGDLDDDRPENDDDGDDADDEPNIVFGGKTSAPKQNIKTVVQKNIKKPTVSTDEDAEADGDDDGEDAEADGDGDGEDGIEDDDEGLDGYDDSNIVVLPKKLAIDSEFADQEYIERQIIIKPEERMCPGRLSEYEQTELWSIRGTQIENYNNPMVDCKGLTEPIEMAKKELREKMSPLMLRRFVGEAIRDGMWCKFYEDWDPNKMEHPFK